MKYTFDIDLPGSVTFYGDPLCPWTLKSYLLVKTACTDLGIKLDYKPLSLKVINKDKEIPAKIRSKLDNLYFLLRLAQYISDRNLNNEPLRYYEITADNLVNQNTDLTISNISSFIPEIQIPEDVLKILSDSSYLDLELQETYESLKSVAGDDYGSPVIMFEPEHTGFFGPIIDEPDSIDAKQFFINLISLARAKTFSEIKRKR